jgi:hypothetical protein
MNMKNDYDDKYVEKGKGRRGKRRLGCLNSYLASGGDASQPRE